MKRLHSPNKMNLTLLSNEKQQQAKEMTARLEVEMFLFRMKISFTQNRFGDFVQFTHRVLKLFLIFKQCLWRFVVVLLLEDFRPSILFIAERFLCWTRLDPKTKGRREFVILIEFISGRWRWGWREQLNVGRFTWQRKSLDDRSYWNSNWFSIDTFEFLHPKDSSSPKKKKRGPYDRLAWNSNGCVIDMNGHVTRKWKIDRNRSICRLGRGEVSEIDERNMPKSRQRKNEPYFVWIFVVREDLLLFIVEDLHERSTTRPKVELKDWAKEFLELTSFRWKEESERSECSSRSLRRNEVDRWHPTRSPTRIEGIYTDRSIVRMSQDEDEPLLWQSECRCWTSSMIVESNDLSDVGEELLSR